MNALALPTPLPDVLALSIPVPPASLERARADRDGLARLLAREHQAAADFLVALADFDRRRGWERLGHASLFAFLTRELALSKGAAYLRLTAARLLPRFPAVEAGLREGRLCLSSVGELAKVLTAENEALVLPRFTGCSAREAREVAASIRPVEEPPRREVVTRLPGGHARAVPAPAPLPLLAASPTHLATEVLTSELRADGRVRAELRDPVAERPLPRAEAVAAPPAGVVLTSEPRSATPDTLPRASAEPLGAGLRRLHLTVSKDFLEKVERARRPRSPPASWSWRCEGCSARERCPRAGGRPTPWPARSPRIS